MADPTTHPRPATFARGYWSSAVPEAQGVEAAGQTYKAGCFLIDDDAGSLVPSTSPIDGSAVANRAAVFAETDATGVTAAVVRGIAVTGHAVFEMTLTASGGTHTLAQGDQWQVFPIAQDSVNLSWFLDGTAGTIGGLVIGFRDAIGTVDGRVYAVLTTSARGPAHAASDTI